MSVTICYFVALLLHVSAHDDDILGDVSCHETHVYVDVVKDVHT
jgi:hypothetical protein